MQCVSRVWRSRIGKALRHRYGWDLIYCEQAYHAPYFWLEHVVSAEVNIRSLDLVSDPTLSHL